MYMQAHTYIGVCVYIQYLYNINWCVYVYTIHRRMCKYTIYAGVCVNIQCIYTGYGAPAFQGAPPAPPPAGLPAGWQMFRCVCV